MDEGCCAGVWGERQTSDTEDISPVSVWPSDSLGASHNGEQVNEQGEDGLMRPAVIHDYLLEPPWRK